MSEVKRKHSLKGKTYEEIYGSEEAKQQKERRSRSHMGKKLSEETKRKLSLNAPWRGKPSPNRKPPVTVTCLNCGKKFDLVPWKAKGRKYCSKKCQHEHLVPHNKGKGVYIKCAYCGKEFWRPRKLKTQIHCSIECKKEDHREVRICKGCGKEFEIEKFRKRAFCSFECFSKWNKAENHYNWNGGTGNEPYPFEFNKELKEQIKNRDDYTCQKCGSREKLAVHHMDYNKKNCDPSNLITLCNKCNASVNVKRIFWLGYFTRMLEERLKELE